MSEEDGSQGLKRHPALVPLSRDHHFALMHALGLRRAAEATLPGTRGPVTTAEAFLAYYHDDLCGHIADEEEALLPLSSPTRPEHAARVRAEHQDLHEQVALLRQALADGDDPRPVMKEIGERLRDHVRFEERIFFEAVQTALSPDQLEAVGLSIEAHRKARGRTAGCALPSPGIRPVPE